MKKLKSTDEILDESFWTNEWDGTGDEIANLLTQDRNQAYTSLVEGIKAMERAVSGQIDTPGYDKDDQYNQDLRHILENVVKPLYGKE